MTRKSMIVIWKNLFNQDMKLIIIYLDSIEQFKQNEKEIDMITGINDDPNVVQYIKFKPR